jgi:non-lysosomal glucosylceramidase
MQHQPTSPKIPDCTWQRPISLDWDTPYTVRYPSNLDDGPWHGMPLGGFGAGCIGRSHRGDFNLWHIDSGEHVFQTIPACQFSIFEKIDDQTQAYALSTEPPEDGSLSTWQWYPSQGLGVRDQGLGKREEGTDDKSSISTPSPSTHPLAPSTGTYHALYPRSWFVYDNGFQASLTCEQFSPILPDNYQETSYPVAVFEWTAHNPTDQPITLSILLTWQNMVGWFTNASKSPDVKLRDDGSPVYEYQPRLEESTGNVNRRVKEGARVGIVMKKTKEKTGDRQPAEGDGQWAILVGDPQSDLAVKPPVNTEVFYQTRWNPTGNGAEVWQTFSQNGSLLNQDDGTAAQPGEQIATAIAIRFTLAPGETRQIPFALAWDFPVMEFAQGVEYFKRYTDFFGRGGDNAWAIAHTALQHYKTWQHQIQSWQEPILQRQDLPNWFKMALFNELYILTDGGTLWSAASEQDPVGQFGVLECLDYRWYESLDVRLYGSFGLLMLFPQLEKAVIRAFARAIPASDDRDRVIGYYMTIGADSPLAVRKTAGATPHDLGAPNEHVWQKTNYTSYQDCNLWKDLPCDFVLQVYRAFLLTDPTDIGFLQECWGAISQTLHYLKCFDQNFDGIPENSGAPDQTFDDWKLKGISAYCGGLWLAALEAAIAIGRLLAENTADIRLLTTLSHDIGNFQVWLEQSSPLYQETLWNGQYYRIDSDSGSDIVMADQLCGQFYARLLHLPDIVPPDRAHTALRTVYDACFVKFNQYLAAGTLHQSFTTVQEARLAEEKSTPQPPPFHPPSPIPSHPSPAIGAANGVRPNGTPENPNSTHPLEVWTGINFGLAAFMAQMGMKEEAMAITEAIVQQIYTNGLQFRTPEALTPFGTFRASHYLRAMAIWAVYGVLVGEL